jgi:hypothetical protein
MKEKTANLHQDMRFAPAEQRDQMASLDIGQ